MTIREIKKNIIDRISDNISILEMLNEFGCYENMSDIKKYINDYKRLDYNTISVDVTEFASPTSINIGDTEFIVTIDFTIGITHDKNGENQIDKMSENLRKIIFDLYPANRKYLNAPLEKEAGRHIEFIIK